MCVYIYCVCTYIMYIFVILFVLRDKPKTQHTSNRWYCFAPQRACVCLFIFYHTSFILYALRLYGYVSHLIHKQTFQHFNGVWHFSRRCLSVCVSLSLSITFYLSYSTIYFVAGSLSVSLYCRSFKWNKKHKIKYNSTIIRDICPGRHTVGLNPSSVWLQNELLNHADMMV